MYPFISSYVVERKQYSFADYFYYLRRIYYDNKFMVYMKRK